MSISKNSKSTIYLKISFHPKPHNLVACFFLFCIFPAFLALHQILHGFFLSHLHPSPRFSYLHEGFFLSWHLGRLLLKTSPQPGESWSSWIKWWGLVRILGKQKTPECWEKKHGNGMGMIQKDIFSELGKLRVEKTWNTLFPRNHNFMKWNSKLCEVLIKSIWQVRRSRSAEQIQTAWQSIIADAAASSKKNGCWMVFGHVPSQNARVILR